VVYLDTKEKTREKTREKIIQLIIKNNMITTEKLAISIGVTEKGIEWQINKLKKEGLLKRIGPDKGGQWQIIKN